ncbi:hypothetical protein CARUB_v10011693mg [Capsella rubella]|uniref:Phytosulfokine n=1 Tax=Capsella rubella TaxID=81985 RepID=R0II68_9BRAS|nr:phytosulfokines 1 [Capsella rubella]EOA36553.1 hypothetical protein CARUB_v10011693mg [Capsella rubella]
MMKKKSEVVIFLFTLVLLLSMASRVISREDGVSPPKPSPSAHEESRNSKGDGDRVIECKDSDSEEECLVKKAVAVHTDYIYTQDLNQSP